MFKKTLSILLTAIFLISPPMTVLAQVDWWAGYENPAASGFGFFLTNPDSADRIGSQFMLPGAEGNLWISEQSIWLTQWENATSPLKGINESEESLKGVHLKITFLEANPGVQLITEQPMKGKVSLLTGRSSSEWDTNLPLWGLIRYHNLYPGVDLVVRSTKAGFAWEYEVQDGAEISNLGLRVNGGETLEVSPDGSTVMTDIGAVELPVLSLEGATLPLEQASQTTLQSNLGELIIYPQNALQEPDFLDPTAKLAYSTFLGGSALDDASDVVVDANGNIYITGQTPSLDFPTTPGAFDTSYVLPEAFVAKLDAADQHLVYATFIGGDGTDAGASIAVENGIAYVGGETDSPNFPLAGATAQQDAFLVAINAAGDNLIYATLIGGVDEDRGYAISLENGAAYITGISYSSDFPVTNDSTYKNGGDIFVAKLNNSGSISYATLVGGSNVEAGYGMDVRNGVAWLTGETTSSNFGGTFPGGTAVFVVSLDATGVVSSSRLFGGREKDARGYDLQLDSGGNIYVTGFTNFPAFPVTEGVYSGGYDAFLMKLSPTATLYSTLLGGAGTDQGLGLAIDSSGGIIVTGLTESSNFPVTEDAFQSVWAGSGDAFLTRYFLLGTDPDHRSYSTFLGGTGNDKGLAVEMDDSIYAYVAGQTQSANFPVTTDGLYTTINGSQDGFLSVLAVGPLPLVSIQKTTNGIVVSQPSDLYLPVGTDITWRYDVMNAGEVTLTNVQVTDNMGVVVTCPVNSLGAGDSMQCTATGKAVAGAYSNIGTVVATTPYGTTIGNIDTSHYFGAVPQASLVKMTNDVDSDETPDIFIEEGQTVTWTYEIINSGNVDLTNVQVMDDNGTPLNTLDDHLVCTIPTLAAGTTDNSTCSWVGTAISGLYTNLGVVTGTPPGGLADVSDDDPDSYFGSDPAITIEKRINGAHVTTAPGPYLLYPSAPITWDFFLTNTGNVTLTNVTVVDNHGTANTSDDRIVCSGLELLPGGTHTCTLADTAATLGQYHNVATVTGTPPVGLAVSATDDSFYFGSQPAVNLEFLVNSSLADTSPGLHVLTGSSLNLQYQVTNSGNVTLTNLIVSDPSGTICTIASLAVGASQTCARTTPALSGQRTLLASVTATPPAPLGNVSANDPIFYFGASPEMSIQKQTNGQDGASAPGVYVLSGSTVNWSYTVINTGNVVLNNVTVTDDNGTTVTTDDFVPAGCSGVTLQPLGQVTCSASASAQLGQYTNIATVRGEPPSPLIPINSFDTSNYFGTTLVISLDKQTNGFDATSAPGPLLPVGAPITWSYNVTNTSNVAVDIVIVDDHGTTLNTADDVTFCQENLAAGASTLCTLNGTATAGQYANTAIVTATPPSADLDPVTDQDTSHYYGVLTGVSITKTTNDLDVSAAPGPFVQVGDPVTWEYLVTNTGNVTLTNVTVTDDQGVAVDCGTVTTLAGGASMTCTASGLAVEGQYTNIGTVTAQPPTGFDPVTDLDTSYYYGSTAGINIEKFTNGVDADNATEGPFILVGGEVHWTYTVTNTGNVNLTNVVVMDDNGTPAITTDDISVCTLSTLAAGASNSSCFLNGIALIGQYTNIGRVSAEVENLGGMVYDSDTSFYFGANASIQIIKRTNGIDSNEPPGTYIPTGETVNNAFEITNIGDFDLTSVQVSDESGLLPGCSRDNLLVGEEITCQTTEVASTGQQITSGSVSAIAPMDMGVVTDSDDSYYFGYYLDLEIAKYTNGLDVSSPPGPELRIGSTVNWTYEVVNRSNVPLDTVAVSDDTGVTVTCPQDVLAVDEDFTCSASGIVVEGQYTNTGTVSGRFDGHVVQEEDVSYYFGIPYHLLFVPLLLR